MTPAASRILSVQEVVICAPRSFPVHWSQVRTTVNQWLLVVCVRMTADPSGVVNHRLEDMVGRRRHTLTDDLISELIRAEDDGQTLDHDELLLWPWPCSARAPTPRATNSPPP
jgi:hypothetical protein